MSSLLLQDFESYHRNLLTSIGQYQEHHSSLQLLVQTTAAGSLVSLSSLPPKLNPIIRPLMDSIKTHSDPLLQSLTAKWLSVLLELSIERTPSPNNKIIKNLAGYLCSDASHTPPIKPVATNGRSFEEPGHTHPKDSSNIISWSISDGIISLMKNNKVLFYCIFYILLMKNNIYIIYILFRRYQRHSNQEKVQEDQLYQIKKLIAIADSLLETILNRMFVLVLLTMVTSWLY